MNDEHLAEVKTQLAAAAGVSRVAIRHAFATLSLRTDMDEEGRVIFVRA